MQTVYICGCKRGYEMISPEMKAASSCRVLVSPQSSVFLCCAPYNSLAEYIQKLRGHNARVTVQDIREHFTRIAQPGLDAMAEMGVPIYHTVQQTNDVLYVPAGWVIFEQGLGGNSTGV
eukprot:1236183-Alexandrium_andersonii.AAC.1